MQNSTLAMKYLSRPWRVGLSFMLISGVIYSLVMGCSGNTEMSRPQPSSPNPNSPATAATNSVGLVVEEVVLAQPGPGDKLEPVANSTFARGIKVHMVLVNVSGFQKGADGKNQLDIDLKVQDPNGNVIYIQQGLLGAAGRSNLPNNIASSPYGAFETSSKLPPGNYTMTLTIRDLVGKGQATASRTVILK